MKSILDQEKVARNKVEAKLDVFKKQNSALVVVQLLIGQFIPSVESLAVAILHPRQLVVYEIVPQGGKVRSRSFLRPVPPVRSRTTPFFRVTSRF